MAAFALQSLPLGFRFHPKDEELVNHYLKNKITGRIKSEVEVIPEIDVCKCEPWELPAKSLIKSEDPEWFFFAPKYRKYPSGRRSNRATKHGYWKATGRDRVIRSSGRKDSIIGMKKTLVFHEGRAPNGARTYWIMHEYRTTEPEFESGDQGSYVLYRLFNKKSEEKSPSSDDLEIHDFSPDGMQNDTDGAEVIELQSNHGSPKSDLQEEPMQRLADKGQCSTSSPAKSETDLCDMALPNEETKLGETADPLEDERVGHGFFNISSPMLQISDIPSSSGMNQEFPIGPNPFDDDDYLNAFLNSILESDDCSSGACIFPKESPAESLAKQAPWDSASCKDSGSNSEIEIEPCLIQGSTSQWFQGSSLGSTSLYPESETQLSILHENPSLYSVDASTESMDDLFNSLEEFNNSSNISVPTEEDLGLPGIKIRSLQSNIHEPPSNNSLSKQGMAVRRIRLLGSISPVPSTGADAESNHSVDEEDKNSIPESTQTLSDSIEEASDSESQVGDTEQQQHHDGDPLGDKISESKENSWPTSASIHDAATSSSSNHQNPESTMRLRKKSANECGKSVNLSSNSMGLMMNHSAVARMIYLILSVVVLLLVSGIYRLTISVVE